MTEPTNKELDAVIKHHRTRIYPQDMQPHFERAIMRAGLAKWGQPAQAAEPVATQWLAEMIMSDCGCSTGNQRLLDRIIDRIQHYDRANTAPQPVAREPLTPDQIAEIADAAHREYDRLVSSGQCAPRWSAVFAHLLEMHHGIKGDQHVE
jgi:hypothetical protein